jgi:hypothetical protein
MRLGSISVGSIVDRKHYPQFLKIHLVSDCPLILIRSIALTFLDFSLMILEKLAVLVPAPRFNLVRYSGILAPSASWRPHVIPTQRELLDDYRSPSRCPHKTETDFAAGQSETRPASHSRRYAWAQLLIRVFSVDVLKCDRCGGRMRILCAINPPEAIRKILDCLGLPTRPPPVSPAVIGYSGYSDESSS